MSERLIVSVDSSLHSPDTLEVHDVFQHIIELFQLVSESDPGNDGDIVWRLVNVSMNSPLTVTAEAVAARPEMNIDVDQIARNQKRNFSSNYAALRSGRIPGAWQSTHNRKIVKNVLDRNLNGIGRTNIDFELPEEEATPIILTPDDAEIAVHTLEIESVDVLGKPKEQIGSIEGKLVEVTTYYGKPAIRLKERRSDNEVICIVPEEFKHEISDTASIEDVWNGRRVIVRGVITYNDNHTISRISASHIRAIDAQSFPVEAIQDKTFTNGLSVTEYLEKLREGHIG
jgi:hypothetical protein